MRIHPLNALTLSYFVFKLLPLPFLAVLSVVSVLARFLLLAEGVGCEVAGVWYPA
jgi:hypothetical protein